MTPSKKGKSNAVIDGDNDSKHLEEATKLPNGRASTSVIGRKNKTDADDEKGIKHRDQNGRTQVTSSNRSPVSPVDRKVDKGRNGRSNQPARDDEVLRKEPSGRNSREGDQEAQKSETGRNDRSVSKRQVALKDKEDQRKGRKEDTDDAHREDRHAKRDERQSVSKSSRDEDRRESGKLGREDKKVDEKSRIERKGEEGDRNAKRSEQSTKRAGPARESERGSDRKAGSLKDQTPGSTSIGSNDKASFDESDDEGAPSSLRKTAKQLEDDRARKYSVDSSNGSPSKATPSKTTATSQSPPKRKRADGESPKEDTTDEPLHFRKKKKEVEAPMVSKSHIKEKNMLGDLVSSPLRVLGGRVRNHAGHRR